MQANVDGWKRLVDDAEKGMQFLNAERDRFHADSRANLALAISFVSVGISGSALLLALIAFVGR
jgi:hypothetical protein